MKSCFIQKFRWLMRNDTTRQYLVHSCIIIYCFGARPNCNNEELLKWVLSIQVETYFCFMWYRRSKWRRLVEHLQLMKWFRCPGTLTLCCVYGWLQIISSLMVHPKGVENKERQSRQTCAYSHTLYLSLFLSPIFNHRKPSKNNLYKGTTCLVAL